MEDNVSKESTAGLRRSVKEYSGHMRFLRLLNAQSHRRPGPALSADLLFASPRFVAAALLAAFCIVSVLSRAQAHDTVNNSALSSFVTPLTDLEATIRVSRYDSAELEKIGADFKTTYSLRNATFQYKQPDKMRLEGRSQTRGGAVLILNGPKRFYEVPKFKIRAMEDLERQPAKRFSLMEWVGLISSGTLKFMDGKLVREEKLGDRQTAVYDMRYQAQPKASYYRVWVDKETRITVRREWFDSANKLRATFLYTEPQEIAPGVWIPLRAEVKNADGVSAAVLTLSDAKANQGLTDEPFTIAP